MINCLNNSINSNSTAQQCNSSVISEGQNFVSALSNYFQTETDCDKRRKFTIAQFSLMSSPAHKMCYLALISGNGFTCYFYKIIASSHYVCFIILFYNIFFYIFFKCTNNNATIYNQTIQEDYPHCCKCDKNNNTELVTALIYDFKPLLLSGQVSSFNSFLNSIINCIYKLNVGNYLAAYQCCIPYLQSYSSNYAQLRGLLMKTILWPYYTIQSNILVPGNVSGMCTCN